MRNSVYIIIFFLITSMLLGCGYVFPRQAKILVRNNLDVSNVEYDFKDAYLFGAGIETEKADISNGDEAVYNLLWFGEKSNFEFSAITEYDSGSGITEGSYTYTIQDVGDSDTIRLEITSSGAEVDKKYNITSTATPKNSREQ